MPHRTSASRRFRTFPFAMTGTDTAALTSRIASQSASVVIRRARWRPCTASAETPADWSARASAIVSDVVPSSRICGCECEAPNTGHPIRLHRARQWTQCPVPPPHPHGGKHGVGPEAATRIVQANAGRWVARARMRRPASGDAMRARLRGDGDSQVCHEGFDDELHFSNVLRKESAVSCASTRMIGNAMPCGAGARRYSGCGAAGAAAGAGCTHLLFQRTSVGSLS